MAQVSARRVVVALMSAMVILKNKDGGRKIIVLNVFVLGVGVEWVAVQKVEG